MPAIGRAKGAELVAVASRDHGKLGEIREKFSVDRLHLGYEALLADPEVDAVYIPLPNSLHCEWTIKAAEAGKHVLCEKPIALTAAEARKMVAACAANRVKLMEAFMYRYTERTRLVVETVRSGALGEIRGVEAAHKFTLNRPDSIKLQETLGGGSLYDVGCYPLNFGAMIADLAAKAAPGSVRPVSVCGQAIVSRGIDVQFSGVVRYATGLLSTIHSGFNSHRRMGAEIVGTEGTLAVPDTFIDVPGKLVLTRGDERREITVPESDRYRSEIEDFSKAIAESTDPLFGLAETIRNAEVMDKLLATISS